MCPSHFCTITQGKLTMLLSMQSCILLSIYRLIMQLLFPIFGGLWYFLWDYSDFTESCASVPDLHSLGTMISAHTPPIVLYLLFCVIVGHGWTVFRLCLSHKLGSWIIPLYTPSLNIWWSLYLGLNHIIWSVISRWTQ